MPHYPRARHRAWDVVLLVEWLKDKRKVNVLCIGGASNVICIICDSIFRHVHPQSMLLLSTSLKVILQYIYFLQEFKTTNLATGALPFWTQPPIIFQSPGCNGSQCHPRIVIYTFEQLLEPSTPYLGYSDIPACCLVCFFSPNFFGTLNLLFRNSTYLRTATYLVTPSDSVSRTLQS